MKNKYKYEYLIAKSYKRSTRVRVPVPIKMEREKSGPLYLKKRDKCLITNKEKALRRPYNISRIKLKELMNENKIIGFKNVGY